MPHWTFEQHYQAILQQGLPFAPRLGEGTRQSPLGSPTGENIVRDPARERSLITNYLDQQTAVHRRLLDAMASDLRPMLPACRISVLLPCRNEAHHIHQRLNLLAEQFAPDGRLLDRSSYEVIVLVNNSSDEPIDRTAQMAKAWAHPLGLNLSVIEFQHAQAESAPLTYARKILADLALLRAIRRETYPAPLYLASEDADVLWSDPRQLWEMINCFERNPAIDGIRGNQDRCPWLLIEHPVVLLMRRSWNFCESYAACRALRPDRNPGYQFNWNRHVTSGWNTAFTAEIYASIGGYSRLRKFEEDLDIGEKISVLRAYESPRGLVPQVNTVIRLPIRAEASPRRWYYRTAVGVDPYDDRDDYANFFSQEHEHVLKTRSLEYLSDLIAPVSKIEPANIPLLRELLQTDLDFLVRLRGSVELASEAYRRILAWLGFLEHEASVQDGQVSIESLASVRRQIERLASRLPGCPVPANSQISRSPRRSCPRQI